MMHTHNHDSGGGRSTPGDAGQWADPAQQSLADALRVSFWVLKLIMALLVASYLWSGVFNVSEQEHAVRLRFGRIVGPPGEQVLGPGGPYFSWPYPFEQVVVIPASPQQIELAREFWYSTDQSGAGQPQAGPLNPEKDGSLLTGDAEVVHARWSVTYVVEDPIAYLTRVKDSATAGRVVRVAVEQGVVGAVAGLTADELIRSQNLSAARQRAQAVLDDLHTGLSITTLAVKEPTFPMSVQAAVQEALNSEGVKAKLIEQAHEQWVRTLVQAAGEAYEPLLDLIEQYEAARLSGDEARVREVEAVIDRVFSELTIEVDGRPVTIGGAVAEAIHQAKGYRTEVVAQTRSEAEYFNSLLPQYRKNPRILASRLWQDARQRILTGDVETMYLPAGQTYLEINRDPRVRQEREKRRLSEEEKPTNGNPSGER